MVDGKDGHLKYGKHLPRKRYGVLNIGFCLGFHFYLTFIGSWGKDLKHFHCSFNLNQAGGVWVGGWGANLEIKRVISLEPNVGFTSTQVTDLSLSVI